MLQGEHSAILSTFIKLPFVFKTFVLSMFEWPLKTGFTVPPFGIVYIPYGLINAPLEYVCVPFDLSNAPLEFVSVQSHCCSRTVRFLFSSANAFTFPDISLCFL